MRTRLGSLLTVAIALLSAGANPGCSCSRTNGMMTGPDLSGGAPEDMAAPAVAGDLGSIQLSGDGGCSPGGDSCASDGTCCSGHCDPTAHLCTVGACAQSGAACSSATDCCNLDCIAGSCSSAACVSDNQPCAAGGPGCCSTQCVNGSCKPLNGTCKTAGNDCAANADCCSQTCTAGKCAPPSTVSYCTQVGDICLHDNECCTGVCTIASGAAAGTCAAIATSCNVDGTVCSGCTGCCSSFCAPFGASTTTHICQPAGGCHVLGDLCLDDLDCCGGDATNGLPGSGLVRCIPDPQHPQIGTCSMANPNYCPAPPPNPNTCKNTCQPEGDVCHFKNNGGCSSNSFPDNCCGAPGNKGMCQLDAHGVPRCHGLGTMCVMPGGACASQADCCNGTPCLPGPTGALQCGSTSCVQPGNTCTATSDCCSGYACIIPPGATSGTCINPNPPPTLPADMAGSNGGVYDLSTPPPSCALVAQSCSSTQPCCAGNGNCSSPAGAACAANESDCFCVLPIQ